MTNDSPVRSRALLILTLGAICISFAAIFVKWIGLDKLGPTAIGFWRAFFGGIILFLMAALRGRRLLMPGPLYLLSLPAGFIFFLDLFLWHRSILYAGAGMATILANTQVFATTVLSFFVFKERITIRFMLAAVSAMIGVVLLVGVFTESVSVAGRYAHGIAFGLLTGIVYASYIIIVKKAGQRKDFPDFILFMAWTSIFTASFLALAMVVESGRVLPPDLTSLGLLILLALVAQALGWWAISWSLNRLEASRAGLILLLQPILATIWGVIFFAEYLEWTQIIGAVVTIAAIYIGSLRNQRVRRLD